MDVQHSIVYNKEKLETMCPKYRASEINSIQLCSH